MDENKRKTMIRKAEDILESDPPLIPVAYEQIYDAWYNRVRGQNPTQVLRDLRRRALGHGLDGSVLGPSRARAEVPAPAGAVRPRAPLIGVSLIIFVVLRILPGDPLVAILGVEGHAKMAPADRAVIMRDLGLSDPLPVQYVRWLRDIATGQLGKSFFRGDTVADLILHRGPLSAEIAILALIISWLVGLPVGILSAIRPNSWADALARFALRPVHRGARLLARHADRAGAAVLVRLQVADHHRAALGEPLAELPDHHRARDRARASPRAPTSRACPARACWRSSARTTCAPRAPRARRSARW